MRHIISKKEERKNIINIDGIAQEDTFRKNPFMMNYNNFNYIYSLLENDNFINFLQKKKNCNFIELFKHFENSEERSIN